MLNINKHVEKKLLLSNNSQQIRSKNLKYDCISHNALLQFLIYFYHFIIHLKITPIIIKQKYVLNNLHNYQAYRLYFEAKNMCNRSAKKKFILMKLFVLNFSNVGQTFKLDQGLVSRKNYHLKIKNLFIYQFFVKQAFGLTSRCTL